MFIKRLHHQMYFFNEEKQYNFSRMERFIILNCLYMARFINSTVLPTKIAHLLFQLHQDIKLHQDILNQLAFGLISEFYA